jgi:hypothetical protein
MQKCVKGSGRASILLLLVREMHRITVRVDGWDLASLASNCLLRLTLAGDQRPHAVTPYGKLAMRMGLQRGGRRSLDERPLCHDQHPL